MIRGQISADGVPTIDIQIQDQTWKAIVDTGFNGELELPIRLQQFINSEFVGRAISLLAANQQIEEDIYLVDFPFDGRVRRAQSTFVDGDEILVGTGMLREYRLTIDFPADIVTIARAEEASSPVS